LEFRPRRRLRKGFGGRSHQVRRMATVFRASGAPRTAPHPTVEAPPTPPRGWSLGVTRPSDSSPRGRGHRGPTRRPNPRPPCGCCLGRAPPPFHRALPPLAGLCAGRLFRAASGCCLALGSVVFARNVKVQTGPRRDVRSRELFDGRKEKAVYTLRSTPKRKIEH
jgi:hypothetical protein